jgi:hypothetical protein
MIKVAWDRVTRDNVLRAFRHRSSSEQPASPSRRMAAPTLRSPVACRRLPHYSGAHPYASFKKLKKERFECTQIYLSSSKVQPYFLSLLALSL